MKLIKVMDADAIEDGVWFQLTVPGTTDPLFRDEERTLPCRVKVRSDKSEAFRSGNLKFQQRIQQRQARAKASEKDDLAVRSLGQQREEWFALLLVAMENCDAEKGGPVTPSMEEKFSLIRDDAGRPISENVWLMDQVLGFGLNEQNFGIASGNADGGEKKPPGSKTK